MSYRTALLFLCLPLLLTATERLQVSTNGHHLEWSDGRPFYIVADTAWSLTCEYELEEITQYLDRTAQQGYFNTIQFNGVFARKWTRDTLLPQAFHNNDFLQPVESYWEKVDWVVQQITDRGFVACINPIWIKYVEDCIRQNKPDACRRFGEWFAQRYKDNPRVIYFIGGDKGPQKVRKEMHALAEGIQSVYGGTAILAYHAGSDTSSREDLPEAPAWLTLNWTYAYCPVYRKEMPYAQNQLNYALNPPMPIQFGEGYYDLGKTIRSKTGTSAGWGTRYVLRRQAWWASFLSGSSGQAYGAQQIWHHAHGHKTWRDALDFDSRHDIGHLKNLVEQLPWWTLQPTPSHSFLTRTAGTHGDYDYSVAVINAERTLAVLYTPVQQSFDLRLEQFAPGKLTLQWFDPTSGKSTSHRALKVPMFKSPDTNAAGDADYVLVIRVEPEVAPSND